MRKLRLKQFFAEKHWRRVWILSLCFALLAGTTFSASAFELTKVRNKSFEKDKDGDGIPNAWTGSNLTAKDKRVCNKSKHRKCSFKMVADSTPNYLTQEALYSSGLAGVTATVSGWMKGKDLAGAGQTFLAMQFNYSGGSKSCGFPQAGGTFGWTKVTMDCVAEEPFDAMIIYMTTNEDSGKVWFDKVKLTSVAP